MAQLHSHHDEEDHDHRNMAPSVPLYAAMALVVLTVLGVAYQRLVVVPAAAAAAIESPPPARAPAVESQALMFADAADGGVIVMAHPGDEVLGNIAAGEASFLRGVLRSLVRERRMQGAATDAGFRLTRFADGRVTLTDLATERELDLRAFGYENATDFIRYLPSQQAAATNPQAAVARSEGD